MKIQLDLAAKTITTNEDMNLGELIDALSKLFPEEQWREYTLNRVSHIDWTTTPMTPVTPPYSPPWIQPYYGGTGIITNNANTLTNSVYNLDLQK